MRECATVTVALREVSSSAMGLPTIRLRPTTTASAPSSSTPARSSSHMIPAGVHGTEPGSPRIRRPRLIGEKPSTSLSGWMRFAIATSESWSGTGSCTSIPSTAGSALSSSMRASSSSWVVSAGSTTRRETMPASSAAFALPAW